MQKPIRVDPREKRFHSSTVEFRSTPLTSPEVWKTIRSDRYIFRKITEPIFHIHYVTKSVFYTVRNGVMKKKKCTLYLRVRLRPDEGNGK